MDMKTFIKEGYKMVDYIADYMESVSKRRVVSDVPTGYLKSVFPSEAPTAPESFDTIMEDVEKHILPALPHTQHPRFHAYLPVSSSYPSILGSIMTDTLGLVGFNWNISPSGSELEVLALNWLGKMIGLPKIFLQDKKGKGAGIIYRSTNECIFISMITARQNTFVQLSQIKPSMSKSTLLHSLVAYCSSACDPCIISSASVSQIHIKLLETDEKCRIRSETLAKAINEDKKSGLIPFFLCISLATPCGACDPVDELVDVCQKNGIWIHINAAYGGITMICPENRHLLKGIEHVSSFSVSPCRGMLVSFDCAVLFVTDRFSVNDALVIDRTVHGYSFAERDWGFPSMREFRVIKLFWVLQMYGVEGFQNIIRNHTHLARMFEACVKKDERFEVTSCRFGIVCFRLKGSDIINKHLLHGVNSSGDLFLSAVLCREKKYVIRFVVCNERASEDDITIAWRMIQKCADNLLKACENELPSISMDEFGIGFEC